MTADILSDAPEDIADLNATVAAINELRVCECSLTPLEGLTVATMHMAYTAGLAECIVTDHEHGWLTPEHTWRHLRFHLNGGKQR